MEDKGLSKQEIYEQICSLTAAIRQTGIAKIIFDAATAGNLSDVCSAVETFEKDNAELYGKCLEFGENIANLSFREIEIFGEPDMEKEEVFIFDTNIMDSISFYALMLFAKVDELYFFVSDWSEDDTNVQAFLSGIEDSGYKYLRHFVTNANIFDWIGTKDDAEFMSMPEALVKICTGECIYWFK
jgi:hypothetical protein